VRTLFILNDAPYGSERTYNGLRLAGAIAKKGNNEVRVFLIGDAATSGHRNQKVPQGFYNIEVMLGYIVRHGGLVGICGTCMEARGIADNDISEGTNRSTLAELADWTAWADKVLVF